MRAMLRDPDIRELDPSEVELLWRLYNLHGRDRSRFILDADREIGDMPKAVLASIWEAFRCADRLVLR